MKEETANALDNWVRLITTQVNALQNNEAQKKLLNQAATELTNCLSNEEIA